MRNSVVGFLRAHRVACLVAVDASAWLVAMYISSALRLETWTITPDLHVGPARGLIPAWGVLSLVGIAVLIHTIGAWRLRLHQGRSVVGSFEETFLLASLLAFVGTVVTIFNALMPHLFSARTIPIVATCIALILCSWPRGLWRVLIHDGHRGRDGHAPTPVVVAGAGEAGCQLVLSMQRDPDQHWLPLAFVDDDRFKRHFRYRGVSVLGVLDSVSSVATQVGAETVVIAMPGAGSETVSRVYDAARAAGLTVKVLPSVSALLDGVDHTAVRDIQPEDFLGRQQVDIDVGAISGYLRGKRVLVTGAGGSIGSELCRQIRTFGPAELLMLDRDESALHSLLLSMFGRADLETPDVILANIRDAERLRDIFEARRPEVVFHAAALKHVNLLESHAGEAVKTNVRGTVVVLEAAAAVGVERFVNISTDKAADPQNVLGYSKRIAECLTTSVGKSADGTFLSVRFGNVLGTSGSVLKTFDAQIKAGGPVTVTHPDVTRYFMTVREAVQLVIQAAAIGRKGEALVLDMGQPVRILDVAQQLVDQAPDPIEIVYTGLKDGEKLEEVLIGADEVDDRPFHPLISHVLVPPISTQDGLSIPVSSDNGRGRVSPAKTRRPGAIERTASGPALTRIPLSSPDVGDLEETYVLDAIRSGWVAPLGPTSTHSNRRSPSVWALTMRLH